jgi:hypothetical protein
MRILHLLVLANLLMISIAWGTTFQPLPVEKLIGPADAILLGDFLTSKTVELDDGTLATEARFKIEKELGLDAEDFGLSEIKVFYPGGKRGDRIVQVEGAPTFVPGEKNVVFLTLQPDGRLWVQGLAMGTFKVVRVGGTTMLINAVFPSHPEISRQELGKFLRKVADIKGKSLKEIQSDKYVLESQKERSRKVSGSGQGNSRSIASVENGKENGAEPNVMNSFWLLMILGFLGAFMTWWGRQKMR